MYVLYFTIALFTGLIPVSCADPEGGGGGGGGGTGGIYKNIGFLSNTGADPLKITKLPS